MKKILCFTMAVIMLISMCSFSAFSAEDTELTQKFYDYCVNVFSEDMQPAEEDNVYIYESAVINGITFFSAGSWLDKTERTELFCKFGDINVYSKKKYQPYDLGLYAVSGDEILTLEEVYNEGMVEDVSILNDAFSWRYTFYEDYVPNPENKYESNVIQTIFKPNEWADPYHEIYYYESYEYYSNANASPDEATPDYVLIYCLDNIELPAFSSHVLGDYVLQGSSMHIPFVYGWGVYVPKTGKVYDLVDAYEKGIEGIENVFTEARVGRLMGDMDKDRKITIKDATYIQKIVAGLEGYSDTHIYASSFEDTLPCSIGDFNRDRTMNVKDATAIQKHIAGIE